jgi:hypothetical protein
MTYQCLAQIGIVREGGERQGCRTLDGGRGCTLQIQTKSLERDGKALAYM